MGAAILSGVAVENHNVQIGAIDPNVESARVRLPKGVHVELFSSVADSQGFEPDLLLIAVKPQLFESIADELPMDWSEALVVSVMAGTSVATIERRLGAERVVRVMPNLPAMIGHGMSVGYAEAGRLSAADTERVQCLFETVGAFAWLTEESQIDACTAVSGSGPGYLFAFAQYMEQAAMDEGVPAAVVDKLTRQTLYGSAAMLLSEARSTKELKEAVTSNGGTTAAGLFVLESESAFPKLIPATIRAAHLRAKELSLDL